MKRLFVFILSLLAVSAQQDPELILLVELFRHGTRTPFINPSNASWIIENGPAELTATGMREHFVLGQQIRSRYKDFLPETYNADWLNVYSTGTNRTIESAMSQLDGLFYKGGPSLPPGFTPETNYTQPPIEITVPLSDYSDASLPYYFMDIAVSSNVADYDLILDTTASCPEMVNKVNARKETSEAFEHAYSLLEDDINQIAESIGYENPHSGSLTIWDGVTMADYMLSALWNNEEIPIEYPGTLFEAADYLIAVNMYFEYEMHEDTATFATGMMKEFLKDLQDKVESPESPKKMYMYSGHDINVANIMALFNLTTFDCVMDYMEQQKTFDENCIGNPPYASSAFIELYQDSESDFFVRFQMNEVYYPVCNSSNEEEFCPWDQFATLLNSSIVANFDEVCHDYIFKYKWDGVRPFVVAIGVLSVISLVTLVLIVFVGVSVCCIHLSGKGNKEQKEVFTV